MMGLGKSATLVNDGCEDCGQGCNEEGGDDACPGEGDCPLVPG